MNEHATREEMKAEAIERIKMLDLHSNVLRDFEENDNINISEYKGYLFWANDNDLELIQKIEEEYEILVYHGIKTGTTIGEMLALFYVSKYKDEWEMAREDFKYNESCCYVHNYDEPSFSEFAYSAPPEHPKPQPLCTETAQIEQWHRERCASQKSQTRTPAETFPPP